MRRPELSACRAITCLVAIAALWVFTPGPSQAQFSGLSFGGAASARTASIAFDNPAGMVMFEQEEYLLGTVVVEKDVRFEGSSTRYFGPRVEGGSSSNAINTALNGFYVRPTEGRWTFGFGIFSLPTVRDLQYDRILAQITKEKFNAFNVGAAAAYQVSDKFSVGASLHLQWAEFWCNMQLPELDPATGAFREGIPGFMTTYGDDYEFGYRIGLLYQFSQDTRLGLSYFSELEHRLTGYSTYTSDTIPDSRAGGYAIDFPFPPFAMLSAHHDLTDEWGISATIDYTQWSGYWADVLLENLVAPAPFTQLGGPLDMQDTWGYSFGVEFDPPGDWAFVAQYRDAESQTVDQWRSIKDYPNGHTELLLAVRKEITDTVWVDVGYQFIDGDDAPIGSSTTQFGEIGLLTWDASAFGLFLTVSPKTKRGEG